MEAKRAKILAAAVIGGFLILVTPILWHSLGLSTAFYILAGVDLAAVFSIFVWLIVQYFSCDQRQKSMVRRVREGEELRLEYSDLRKVGGLPARYRYEVLRSATDNFQSPIGHGSSASVFKGVLADGTAVAVKRIEVSDHGEVEFRREVAAIASVQHINLARLLGYCLVPKHGLRFLVYEFAHNSSLNKWIFPREGHHHQCLPWQARYRVAVDVAKALAYLHSDCRARVLHLDVKPENILLDENFRAVVSDFGLSKVMQKEESRVVTTVRGTRGYLAPEWFVGQGVSEKCDVFSYGMVLLELVAGRRGVRVVGDGVRREWSYLPRLVMEKASQGRLSEVVDDRLVRSGVGPPEREVRAVVHIALWCIREEVKLRPSMAEVVDMLQGRVEVEAPPLEAERLVFDLVTMEYVTLGGAAPPPVGQLENQSPVPSTYSMAISILSGR